MPLKQYPIATQSWGKLKPVYIFELSNVASLPRRKVGAVGIVRVKVGAMSRYEPQPVCIKAGLCSLARRDRTRLERKVPQVMRRQNDLKVDLLSAIVGSLNPRAKILVVIPSIGLATGSQPIFFVETMGAKFLLFFPGDPVARFG
jgi:hypothetical protein